MARKPGPLTTKTRKSSSSETQGDLAITVVPGRLKDFVERHQAPPGAPREVKRTGCEAQGTIRCIFFSITMKLELILKVK